MFLGCGEPACGCSTSSSSPIKKFLIPSPIWESLSTAFLKFNPSGAPFNVTFLQLANADDGLPVNAALDSYGVPPLVK